MTRFRMGLGLAALVSCTLCACTGSQVAPNTPETEDEGSTSGAATTSNKAITKAPFGTVDGQAVDLYTLTNNNGLSLKVTNYGVIITEFQVPDRDGQFADIVGGYDNVDGYVEKTPYFGTTVGRVANRIKNAKFELEGKTYELATNNGPHNLHGGTKGWDKVIWTAEPGENADDPSVAFTYVSKDGEEGFPGTVTAKVTYTLTSQNELKVDIEATTDKTTIVNPAHHSYWMLQGVGQGGIGDLLLTIHAEKYTPGDKPSDPNVARVPDGTIEPVEGTPFDFRTPKAIGKDMAAVGGTPVGYDHFWIVDGAPSTLRPVATVKDPKSGRVMTLTADQIGVQFYAGIFLDGTIKGKGVTYNQYDALCLETHAWVNAINVPEWKDAVILKPGETYTQHMVHTFTAE